MKGPAIGMNIRRHILKLFVKIYMVLCQTFMPFKLPCICFSSSSMAFESSRVSGVRTPATVMTIDNRKKTRTVRIFLDLTEEFPQKLPTVLKPSLVRYVLGSILKARNPLAIGFSTSLILTFFSTPDWFAAKPLTSCSAAIKEYKYTLSSEILG